MTSPAAVTFRLVVRHTDDGESGGYTPATTPARCGGAPQADASACCALDETRKAAGEPGCGCAADAAAAEGLAANSCCPKPDQEAR